MTNRNHIMLRALSFCVATLLVCTTHAQQVFSHELGVDGARLNQMIALSDGNILAMGRLDNGLYFVKYIPAGDTLWTKHHPSILPPSSVIELSDGRFLVTRFDNNHIFNELGELVGQFGAQGNNPIQLPDGMLLFNRLDSLRKTDLEGGHIWSKKIVGPASPVTHQGTLLGIHDNGILTYSAFHGGGPVGNTHALLLGRYDHLGELTDTTRVYHNDYTGWLMPVAFKSLPTGGWVGVSSIGTASATMFRTSSAGEVAWTNTFGLGSSIDPYITPNDITGTADDRIVISGISDQQIDPDDNISYWIRLAEFNEAGDFICVEDIATDTIMPAPNRVNILSGIDVAEHHVLYFSDTDNTLYGYNELCLPTAIEEPAHVFELISTPGYLEVRLNYETSAHWAMYDMSGRRSGDGNFNAKHLTIPVHSYPPGQYLIVITDRQGGRSARKAMLVH